MFGWLTRYHRRARRAHESLWEPERVIGADGLSFFQRRAEAELTSAGYTLRERAVAPLREAIAMHIEQLKRDGQPVPRPSSEWAFVDIEAA